MLELSRSSKEYKIVGDPAATAEHDAQDPDPPVRPTVEENVMSKGQELLPPEGPGGQRVRNDSKDKAEPSEEQRAEAGSCKECLTHRRRSARP